MRCPVEQGFVEVLDAANRKRGKSRAPSRSAGRKAQITRAVSAGVFSSQEREGGFRPSPLFVLVTGPPDFLLFPRAE